MRGREQELAAIGGRLASVRGGRGATLFVEGRPGFGKTRLLQEAASMAEPLGIRVGWGAIDAEDQVVPMSALVAALFDGPKPLADLGARHGLPYLPEQRYWLLEELESLVERVALEAPLLLCLDDMQWADHGCLVALRTLPQRLADLPIVWLVAFRGGQAHSDLRSAIESLGAIATSLVLGPLDQTAVSRMAADVFHAPPEAALLELAGRAHGSPFLLVELLRGLQEDGLVHIEGGMACLVEERLPLRFRDTMRDRLARVSAPARHVAHVASVLGRRFSMDQLAVMLDAPPAQLLEPVAELLEAELLTEEGAWLSYRHDLIREAVRETLPASSRRALQRQAVDALLATGSVPVDVAMQLAASAEVGDQVAVRALREAAQALASSDPATAVELSRRAYELATAVDPLRATLAAETVLLLHTAGRVAEGRAFADSVLSDVLPNDQEAEVRLGIAGMLALSPDVRAESGRRALALPGVSAVLRARHLTRLVHNLLSAGRFADARALVPEARTAATVTADPGATFALDLAEGGLDYTAGYFERSLARIEATARLGASAGEPARELLAQEWRSELLAVLDRYEESMAITVQHVTAAQGFHQTWALRLWECWRGRQLFQLGNLRDAAAALEGALAAGEYEVMVGVLDAAAIVALGRTAIHMGDEAVVRRCVGVAQVLSKSGTPEVERHAAWLLALVALAEGDASAARDHLLAPPDRPLPLLPMDIADDVALVRIGVETSDDALVTRGLAQASARRTLNPEVASVAGCAAHAGALSTGQGADFDAAIGYLRRGPRRLALASALEDAGKLAAQRGEQSEATDLLGEALDLYHCAGASWDAARVRARLRSMGVRRRLAATSSSTMGWQALTASELHVVRLVAGGLTNREAAERLFVSPHTVGTHLRHAFTKLQITSRVELARLAAIHDADTT